ncbi:MAG: response regulator [Pseudolabrys sp.]|jgi:two-component system chemotaxis response regulator CheY
MLSDTRSISERFAAAKVLVVDDEHFMRKVVRTLLMSLGVRDIYEAHDGISGLEAIRSLAPHVVILDWQMPGLDGAAFARIVRSPDTFPFPDVPIIMLTGHAERARVTEAVEIGVNEFLLKPVSTKALQDRLISVLAKPRPLLCDGNNFKLAPRHAPVPNIHADSDETIANLVMLN